MDYAMVSEQPREGTPMKQRSKWLLLLLFVCVAGSFWALRNPPEGTSGEEHHASVHLESGRQDTPPIHPSQDSVRVELIAVVESQLAAFRENDFTKAYHHASASIKNRFALPAFEQMVKSQYPVIAHSKSALFGVVLDDSEEAVVNVRIESASDGTADYRYLMKRENGDWKIQGVVRVTNQESTI
jgi:hypothetical protein